MSRLRDSRHNSRAGHPGWLRCASLTYFGPGYRLYFGKDGDAVIVLLAGGSKSSQAADIRRAQEFWREYVEVNKYGTAQ